MSFLLCKILCIVIIFLVLWFICWSSSLVYFKNGPEYLTRWTTQVYILLISFQPNSLVSSCFLVHMKYSFLDFFIHLQLVGNGGSLKPISYNVFRNTIKFKYSLGRRTLCLLLKRSLLRLVNMWLFNGELFVLISCFVGMIRFQIEFSTQNCIILK